MFKFCNSQTSHKNDIGNSWIAQQSPHMSVEGQSAKIVELINAPKQAMQLGGKFCGKENSNKNPKKGKIMDPTFTIFGPP